MDGETETDVERDRQFGKRHGKERGRGGLGVCVCRHGEQQQQHLWMNKLVRARVCVPPLWWSRGSERRFARTAALTWTVDTVPGLGPPKATHGLYTNTLPLSLRRHFDE